MNKAALIAGFLLAATMCAAQDDAFSDAPDVRVNGEELQGAWYDSEQTIAVFRGVPFAQSPVGDLRWRAPRPHSPRHGPQPATEFAPGCMQGMHIVKWYADVAAYFGAGPGSTGEPNGVSEDCLYVNVWAPKAQLLDDAEKLPVMVWFHGGSNKGGWSYEPNYIGGELAKRDVVVVTVAYRLGPFGFFSHPALSETQPREAAANFGFLDQLMALRWVQQNIEAFGADSKNITCFGESSGAGDLGSVMTTDIELCQRWIAQSPGGSYAELKTLADDQQNGLKIAAELGVGEGKNAAADLRAVTAENLLIAAETALPGHYYDVVLDDQSVHLAPLESLERERQKTIDFMVGTNRDESYMYIDEDTDEQDVDDWLAKVAPESAAVLRAQVADETDPRRALDRLRTAHEMLCESRRVAARVTAVGGRAWVYNFTRQRAGPAGEKVGAYHGTEIPYVFGTHDDWLPTEAIDEQLTDAVMDYWVQFARTGDPNLPGRPTWPLYRAEKPAVLELGEQIQVVPPVDAALCIWLGPK